MESLKDNMPVCSKHSMKLALYVESLLKTQDLPWITIIKQGESEDFCAGTATSSKLDDSPEKP